MPCEFLAVLGRLRKQSQESVDNTDLFEPFKEYMHIERIVESELRKILREANRKQEKSLVMLCGSAGDGKSHLISYLKNSDSENLLEEYESYNDATESDAPSMTALETLAKKLESFNDENIDKNDSKRMIIAINLGMLSKFIESEEGKSFSKLREFVLRNEIISSYGKSNGYIENSVFQYVSFSDYQVFSLTEGGAKTDFLEAVFDKVFNDDESNPFNSFYSNCTCTMKSRCPVRHNYEFLKSKEHQKAIINRIIEVVIEDKAIVSTRDILNFIYDMLVHPAFSYESLNNVAASDIDFLTEYISWTTPMLLNEYRDISPLVDIIKQHDVLKSRKESLDSHTMRFHSLENIETVFSEATANTPYRCIMDFTQISHLGGIKPELKKNVYKFIVRLGSLENKLEETTQQKHLKAYIQYLYYQNTGDVRRLSSLMESTRKARKSAINGETYSCQYDETLILDILPENINSDTGKLDCVLKCGIVEIPIQISDTPNKPDVLTGADALKKKYEVKKSMEFKADKILCGTEEFYTKEQFRRSLEKELLFVNNGWLCICETVDGYEEKRLNIPEEVKSAYLEMIKYLRANRTVPSLVYLSEEYKELAERYITSVENAISAVSVGQSLSTQVNDMLLLGCVIQESGEKIIEMSPLQPLNVLYQCNLSKEKGVSTVRDELIEKLTPLYLLPYIRNTNRELYHAIEQKHSPEWRFYAPFENKRYQGTRNFVQKLVCEKIADYVKFFPFLFEDIDNSLFYLNLVNMGDCREVLNGIIRFYIKELRTKNIDDLIYRDVNGKQNI